MSDRAVLKKAPFHNSKNNMADALLFFGAAEYMYNYQMPEEDWYFVTENYTEFSDPKNQNKLHPDFGELEVHFYRDISQVLQINQEIFLENYYESQINNWLEWKAAIAESE